MTLAVSLSIGLLFTIEGDGEEISLSDTLFASPKEDTAAAEHNLKVNTST